MGTFQTSDGERLEKITIKNRTDKAKNAFKQNAIWDGKAYCWACGKTGKFLSASHIVSVDQCQNDGMTEYAWDTDNLQLECHECQIETEIKKFDHHANARYKKRFRENYDYEKNNK